MKDTSATAIIEDAAIVIRVPISYLHQIVQGGYDCGAIDCKTKITNEAEFAKELCRELNREDEEGTTPVHRLFDAAINEALEQGAEGIEVIEDEDEED